MLTLYTPPTPPPAPVCPSCRTYAPECVVPGEMFGRGGEAVPMCWLCAHAVTEHGGTIEDAYERVAACKCSGHDIYPADVISRRAAFYTTPSEPVRELEAKPAHVARTGGMSARARSAQNRAAAEARWKP